MAVARESGQKQMKVYDAAKRKKLLLSSAYFAQSKQGRNPIGLFISLLSLSCLTIHYFHQYHTDFACFLSEGCSMTSISCAKLTAFDIVVPHVVCLDLSKLLMHVKSCSNGKLQANLNCLRVTVFFPHSLFPSNFSGYFRLSHIH